MVPISLDRILALNDELTALAAAGVPVDLGQAAPRVPVRVALDEAGASIALRQGRGMSLEQSVTDNPDLPPGYGSALAASLKSSRLTTALEACCWPAAALTEVRHVVGRALMGPLVVVTIAYIGLLFLCLHVAPTFEDQYRQLGTEPSSSVRMLATLRHWAPYWAPLVPLLLLGAVVLWRRGTRTGRPVRPLPSLKRYEMAVRDAQLAESLARLVQQHVPPAEALRWSSRMTGQPTRIEAADRLAAAIEHGETVTPEHPDLTGLPPVLRWALVSGQDSPTSTNASEDDQAQSFAKTQTPGSPSLVNNLQFAAQTYHQQVRRRGNFWRVAAPAAGILLLAGPVTLAYALCLFEPLVQLWRDLAQ
jgi:type II secretory pathway component PulF